MNKDLVKLVKQEYVQELVAFGWTGKSLPFYTIRDSIAMATPAIRKETPEVFGYAFADVVQALEAHADLDKKYYPNPIV